VTGGESFVYLQIAEAIRRLIVSGELQAGERLPSVRAMSERWRCTPNTVSRAYSLLSQEGLVIAHRGGGTRVTSRPEGLGVSTSPEWHWAELVNKAESYLLDAVGQGHTPAHAEAALAAAIARWEELRRRPVSGSSSTAVGGDEGSLGVLRFSGSHDLSVELLARFLSEQMPPLTLTTDFIGSLGGLMALARGEAEIAGSHLWDEATRSYNVPFVQRVLPNRKVMLLNLVHRIQGLIVPQGNPQQLHSVADLARPGVVLANRQSGSGTRVWLDVRLRAAGIAPESIAGYSQEETTHMGVARAVAEGRATAGVGISAAATAYGLSFVRLGRERYDLVIPFGSWDSPSVQAVRSVVVSSAFQEAVMALGGYDMSETSSETLVN
jgi:molybdate-binding protein/DNA-binding transcriptional regulator YhcF (GntR family)